MAQPAISDEINRHVEAVLVLSKRDLLLRLLREAELCIGLEQVRTAATLVGIAIEELYLLSDPTILQEHGPTLRGWRELRNPAVHPGLGAQEMDVDVVTAMLTEIRTLLEQIDAPQSRRKTFKRLENEFATIRGKYAFVATSVDDFLKRKHEDLELEGGE